jgi:hypothetical protein
MKPRSGGGFVVSGWTAPDGILSAMDLPEHRGEIKNARSTPAGAKRYYAECSCGWLGQVLATRSGAIEELAHHRAHAEIRDARTTASRGRPSPSLPEGRSPDSL